MGSSLHNLILSGGATVEKVMIYRINPVKGGLIKTVAWGNPGAKSKSPWVKTRTPLDSAAQCCQCQTCCRLKSNNREGDSRSLPSDYSKFGTL